MKMSVAIILIGLLGIAVAQPSCQWTNPITGSQYDISALFNPILDYSAASPQYDFFINPCNGLVNTTDCGAGCTICRTQFGPSICAGKTSSLVFTPPSFAGDGLTATWTSNQITTVIEFVCSTSSQIGKPVWITENPTGTYNFLWRSAYACGSSPECSGSNCQTCLNGTGNSCRWCLDTNSCQSTNSTFGCTNRIIHPKYCPAFDCSGFSDCSDCLSTSNTQFCSWCLDSGSCISNSDTTCGDIINNPKYCSLRH